MATDGGGLSDFLIVRVKVLDENDNAPRFLLKEYKICIASNLTAGVTFSKVSKTAKKLEIFPLIAVFRSKLLTRMKGRQLNWNIQFTRGNHRKLPISLASIHQPVNCFLSETFINGVSGKTLRGVIFYVLKCIYACKQRSTKSFCPKKRNMYTASLLCMDSDI